MKPNKISTRSNIPSQVAQSLRKEAGFGCCMCGHPIYDYHHIIPHATESHYRTEDMMILCPNHHREATIGAVSREKQYKYKNYPHNIQRGFTKGVLATGHSPLLLQLGSVLMVGGGTLLEIDDFPLITVDLDNKGILQVSTSLYDEHDNLLAKVHKNEWVAGDPLPWDLEFGVRWLTLRERKRKISVHVDARKFPVYLRGQLWYKGNQFKIDKSGIKSIGSYINGVFLGLDKLALVAQKIQIDSVSGEIKIISNDKQDRGCIVSQPTPMLRMMEGLKAWQRLRYPNLALRRQ